MAVRQYIGARYVPQFYENSDRTSEWEEGVAYEPLTIVTLNGNSYTSKKAVPANIGAPGQNPAYWVSTGIFNEQIEEYRQEVAALDDRVTEIDGVLASFLNVVDNGIPNDGSDITTALQELIDANPARTIYFPDGQYTISSSIYTNKEEGKETSFVLSKYAEISAATSFVGEFMFELNSTGEAPRNNNKKVYFEGGVLKCNSAASGIIVRGCRNATIRGTFIYDVKRVGVQIFESTYLQPADSFIDDIYVTAPIGSVGTYGIITYGSELNITNTRTARCYIGVKSYRQSVNMYGVHCTQREPSYFASIDDYNGTIAFDFSEGGTADFSSCFSDNYAIGFKLPETESCSLVGCWALWYTNGGHHYAVEQLTGVNFNHMVDDIHIEFFGTATGQENVILHAPAMSNYAPRGTAGRFAFSGVDQTVLKHPFTDRGLMTMLNKIDHVNLGDYTVITQNNWTPVAVIRATGSSVYNLHIQNGSRNMNLIVGLTFSGTALTKNYVRDLAGTGAEFELAVGEVEFDHASTKAGMIFIRRTAGNSTDNYKVFHIPTDEQTMFFLERTCIKGEYASLRNTATIPNQIGSAIILSE